MTESRSLVTLGWGVGRAEGTFLGDVSVHYLDCGYDFISILSCVKMYQMIYFKHIQFIVYQLYLNNHSRKK